MASPTKIIQPTEPLSWGRLGRLLLLGALLFGLLGWALDKYDRLPDPTAAEATARGADFTWSDNPNP